MRSLLRRFDTLRWTTRHDPTHSPPLAGADVRSLYLYRYDAVARYARTRAVMHACICIILARRIAV